jgi:hypothetical protein
LGEAGVDGYDESTSGIETPWRSTADPDPSREDTVHSTIRVGLNGPFIMNHSPLLSNVSIGIGIAICISQSAVFSGLNLAIFSIRKLRLDVAAL